MTGCPEEQPTPVPPAEGAKLLGDVRTRWGWTEPSVWTERMLTSLEQGVKGGKWYSLIDKVWALPTLRAAFEHVKRKKGAAGVDPSAKATPADRIIGAGLTPTLPSGGCSFSQRPVHRIVNPL